jgi:outer membrane protein insertion porin family
MKKIFFFLVLILLFSSLSFGDWKDIEGFKVRKIVFEGVSKAAQDMVKEVLAIKEGEPIESEKVIQTTKNIDSLGIFYDFKIEYEIVDASKKLVDIYVVGTESSIVDDVKFSGNNEVRSDDLKEVVTITKGDYISTYKVLASIAAIKEKYRQEGFLEVAVTPTFTKEGNKNVLVFNIDEGPRSIVKSIKFVGVSNINEGELKSIIETKEENVFLFLPISRGYFDPDKFSKDLEKIAYYYQMKGFIDAKVLSNKVTTTNVVEKNTKDKGGDEKIKEKHVFIIIYISEGKKYYFNDVKIVSDTKIFTKDELLKSFPLIKGDSFAMDQVDKWLYSVNRKYWDRGYVFARVQKDLKRDTENNFVDVEVSIYEGDTGHVGNIFIVGNTYTKEYVIRRELEIEEGELFSVYKLQRSIERLNMTQFFDKVEWEVKEGDAEGIMDLVFKVKEGKGGIISLGAGYGSVSGFSANGSISHVNLFGTGKRIQAKLEIGQYLQSVSVSFTEPYLFNSKYSLTTSVYFYNSLIQNILVDEDRNGIAESTNGQYWQTRIGFGLSFSRRLWSYYSVGVGYSIYDLINHDKNFNNALDDSLNKELVLTSWEQGGKIKSTINLNASVDSRDHPLVPTKGVYSSVSIDYVGHLIGGFFQFIRLSGNFSFYQGIPITENYKLVGVFYTTHGVMLPQFNGVFERETSDLFWFDGYYELRGWQGYGFRGIAKSFYSAELRFPIYENFLWGATFADYGAVFSELVNYTTEPSKYYGSFGFGVMINIPSLPIRMYLARQVRVQDNQLKLFGSDKFFENWQFVFSIQGLF